MPTQSLLAEPPPEIGGRFCFFCQKPIPFKNSKAKYCSDSCRTKARDNNRIISRPFIALDGEGIGSNYILLAAKNKALPTKSVSNLDGLSTKECFDFLLSLPKQIKDTKPLYVWFAFDYDVNMILGNLSQENREEIRKTNETVWEGYKITYIKRKIFKLSCNGKHFHSTDTWSFFAGTFEKALADWGIETPEIITKGKAARQDFSTWELEEIQKYNDAELDALSELLERLRDSVKPLKLKVQSWHGPGAFAGSWLSKNKAKEAIGLIPKHLFEAATVAYFGGRIDAKGFGFVDPVYHYDLVSAYPSATRYLPDLSSVQWQRSKGKPPKEATLYCARVRWKVSLETKHGPFPWRNRAGVIRLPRMGEGWYWNIEIEAARLRFPNEIEIVEAWYTRDSITFPFQTRIEELFAYRNQLKQEGNPTNKAIKLILNSLYGKFAQTVGKAQYYSPVWAGIITAYTRAKISEVITDDTVLIMTDSIWSKSPLSVPTSSELGGWEKQEEVKLTLAEAGLYEAETANGKREIWQRGFDKDNPLDIPEVVNRWLQFEPYNPTYQVNRFVGMGLAAITSYPWRSWQKIERKLWAVPYVGTSKRYPCMDETEAQETGTFQSLELRSWDEDCCSYPYVKSTLDKELIASRLQDDCTDV
jgi:DNA polymerase family B